MSIKIKNVSKSYSNQTALDAVNFEVGDNQVVGFLGPNGAGKSTLMKIICGYIKADKGQVIVDGIDVAKEPMAAKSKIGYLPENNPLYAEMYVKEFLNFMAQLRGIKKPQVDAIIHKTGLKPEYDKKINQLSKGYRQRVGLAGCLLHQPKVLILDEPTTGLDPHQLSSIRHLIKETGQSTTILLSTHIMQEVEAMCERAVIIHQGKLVDDRSLSQTQTDNKQIIEVEFNYRVEEVALEGINQVKKVINTKGFIYQLEFSTSSDKRSDVFDFAYDNGLKILNLQKINQNLEERFLELTARK
jgi:ABC-2 type transport system ATP-binding protein